MLLRLQIAFDTHCTFFFLLPLSLRAADRVFLFSLIWCCSISCSCSCTCFCCFRRSYFVVSFVRSWSCSLCSCSCCACCCCCSRRCSNCTWCCFCFRAVRCCFLGNCRANSNRAVSHQRCAFFLSLLFFLSLPLACFWFHLLVVVVVPRLLSLHPSPTCVFSSFPELVPRFLRPLYDYHWFCCCSCSILLYLWCLCLYNVWVAIDLL